MQRRSIVAVILLSVALAGCNSEEQRKLDASACTGYGFKPGTSEMASCMMQTSQNRQAQQAASDRQQSYNNMVAQQAQKDRDDQAQAAQSAAQQADINRMMNSNSPSFIPSNETTNITTPTIPSIDTSNMHCTGSQGANAGSMSCTSN
jgi:hypothetical protein